MLSLRKRNLIIFSILILGINIGYSKEILLKIVDADINVTLEGVKIYNDKSEEIRYTDQDGKTKIIVNEDVEYLLLTFELIGYQTKKIKAEQFNHELIIKMSIQGSLEGQELVIEGEKMTKNEELGVSRIIDKNQLKSTAMSGMVQDVMSTIKTLPGVSSGGGFGGRGGNNLSVRGGDTDGLTTVLDGFIVRYPYQWGGMYSIFTPNVVDTVKFSSGIFSAKYGLATSAIMEVNSITPDEGFKAMGMFSLADSELYVQTPLWKNSGLLLGGRFIYYDLVNLMMGGVARSLGANLNSQYLRDGYFKWFWKPAERIEWYINGFFGSDGVSMNMDAIGDDQDGITNKFKIDYYNYDTFWNTGFKILPNDKTFVHFFTGYECYINGYTGNTGYKGTQKYSDEFKSYYQKLRMANPSLPDITGIDSFSLDIDSTMESQEILHSIQTRGDVDITLHKNIMMSVGAGGIFDFNKSGSVGSMWQFIWEDGTPVYKKMSYENENEDKQILKSFSYLSFNFNIIPETLKIETGLRLDHNLLFGPGYHLNTYPVPGPRFNLTYTPIKNLRYLDSLSFSIGTGLFSKSPDVSNITKDMGLKDFELTVPKTLTTVIGTELKFPIKLNFKIEGYYKYVFDKYYINTSTSGNETEYKIHTDGIGHAAGFDFTLEKIFSRWLDGSITYSFIYARLLNPQIDDSGDNKAMGGEPTGSWFYPSYHKFHNFNAILNIRPAQWCTITPKLVFSSGAPKSKTSAEQSYAVLEDGQVAEMYTSSSEYNDSLREDFNIQFDLKVSFGSYFPKTKLKWEAFLSVENLFVFIYSPSRGGMINQFTGEDQSSSNASYSSQIPTPNIGFKLEF